MRCRPIVRVLILAAMAAVVVLVVRRRRAQIDYGPTGLAEWPPLTPVPPPTPASEPAPQPPPTRSTWVEPTDGECPDSHPIKANAASGIYHLPTGRFYARTSAERCYCEATDAEADGFRAAKR